MKVTQSIIWDHHGRAPKNGAGEVEIRITVNRKSYYIGTGIKVRKAELAAGRIVNVMGARQMNDRLAMVYEKVAECVNECIKQNCKIDAGEIRRAVWQASEAVREGATLIEWIERQIPLLNVKEGTLKHYRTLVMRLTEYGKLARWQDATVENIYLFDSWLHGLKAQVGEGRIGDAAVYNYHKTLKAMLNRAVKFCKLEANPYDRMKGQLKRGERESVEYLTEDEMQRIEDLTLPEGTPFDTARDLFVFQMYTGLSYSDAIAFNIDDYQWDGKAWRHTGERIKTGVPFVSTLLPPAVKVLEKHGMKVPGMDNSDYNAALKMVGELSGIRKRMHSHLARHTFATYMLRGGVKIENVSRMLGHSNIQQTQRYAKVLAQSVHDDFDMMAAKMRK